MDIELYSEIHDLPNTKDRTHCWIAVHRWEDGSLTCDYYSSSRDTGCDFPKECDVIRV